MSLPIKTVKSVLSSYQNPEAFNNYQTNAKNYYKVYHSLIKERKNGTSPQEINLGNLIVDGSPMYSDQLKDEIKKWLFSLPIEDRIKVATVEMSLITSLIHQMYLYYVGDSSITFKMKESLFTSSTSEESEPNLQNSTKLNSNVSTIQIKKVKNNEIYNKTYAFSTDNSTYEYSEIELLETNLANFFDTKSSRPAINRSSQNMKEATILNDIRFYSIHHLLDSMTLAPNVLIEENLFEHCFKYLGNARYFNSIIKPIYNNKTKLYSYHMPDWMNLNEYYNIFNFIFAFIEQSIVVKFILNFGKKKGGNSNLVHSLLDENRMTQIFQSRRDVISYLERNYSTQQGREEIFDKLIDAKTLHDIVEKDQQVERLVKLKKIRPDQGYTTFASNRKNECEPFLYVKDKKQTELKVKKYFLNSNNITFTDSLLYHSLRSIWKMDFFMAKLIFEKMHDLYTEKNAMDLIEEMEQEESSRNKKSKNSKGGMTKNKNQKKSQIKNIDSDFEYYSIYLIKPRSKIINQVLNNDQDGPSNINLCKPGVNIITNSNQINGNNGIVNIITNPTAIDLEVNESSVVKYFIKYDIIGDIINKVVTTPKTYEDVLTNLNSINEKSNRINELLNKETRITKFDEEEILKKAEEKWNNLNKENKINVDQRVSEELDELENKDLNEGNSINDDVTKEREIHTTNENQTNNDPDFNKTDDNTLNDNPLTTQSMEIPENVETPTQLEQAQFPKKEKKKKKEKTFFLYDTMKKKKSNTKENKQSSQSNLGTCLLNSSSLPVTNSKPNKVEQKKPEETKPNITSHIVNTNQSNDRLNETSKQTSDKERETNASNTTCITTSMKPNYFIFNSVMQMNMNINLNLSFPQHSYNKYYTNEFNTFVHKLHNDILTYNNNVTESLGMLHDIKLYTINYIEKIITSAMSNNISIGVYGSFASDLSIESSDIDIKIKLDTDSNLNSSEIELLILSLVQTLTDLNIFESVNPIYTANIPIVKIVIDPETIADENIKEKIQNFKNSNCYKQYCFNRNEVDKIKIDITFAKESVEINSSVEFAKAKISAYPEVKPLLRVLKRFLQIKKMNNCFSGGLSSFCLFLLILAFVQFKHITQQHVSTNLGRMFLDFLEFYGRIFNFQSYRIDVNLPNPYVVLQEIYEMSTSPIILDPLTYLNASKSSFRINEVKEAFSRALDFLNNYKIRYDKIDVEFKEGSNILYDLMFNC